MRNIKTTPEETVNKVSTILAETFLCIAEVTPDIWHQTPAYVKSENRIDIKISGFQISTGNPIEYNVTIENPIELIDFDKPKKSMYNRLRALYYDIWETLDKAPMSVSTHFTMGKIEKPRCKTDENLWCLQRHISNFVGVSDSFIEFMEYADDFVNKFNTSLAVPDFVIKSHAKLESGGTEVFMESKTGNFNPRAFDFVRVSVPLALACTEPGERRELIKEYGKLIDNFAVRKIRSSKDFQRYGVPVNILRCTEKVYTRDSRLVYTFELKKLEGD